MPYLSSMIHESVTHVVHPIIEQVVRKVLVTTQTYEQFRDHIFIQTDENAVKTTNEDGKHRGRVNRDKVVATAEVSINPSSVEWENFRPIHAGRNELSARNFGAHPAIMVDEISRVFVGETSKPCAISIEMKFFIKDLERAYTLQSMLHHCYPAGVPIIYEDLCYDYPFPRDILTILFGIYKNKRSYKDKTLFEYMGDHSKTPLSLKSDREGSRAEVIVSKYDPSVLVQFSTSDGRPAAVTENNLAVGYEVTTNLIVQFNRPDSVIINYPIIIENNLLDARFISQSIDPYIGEINTADRITRFHNSVSDLNPVIRMPYYDDWIVPHSSIAKFHEYQEFFVAAVTLDANPLKVDREGYLTYNDQVFFIPPSPAQLRFGAEYTTAVNLTSNLTEDGLYLNPDIVSIIEEQGHDTFGFEAPINISIYADDNPINPTMIKLEDNLLIGIPHDNLDRIFHLVVSQKKTIRKMHPKWMKMLLKYTDTFGGLLQQQVRYLLEHELVYVKDNYIYDRKGRPLISETGVSYGTRVPFRVLQSEIKYKSKD